MKSLLMCVFCLMLFVNFGSAKNPKDYTFYDDLTPVKRENLSKSWLDTAKAFYSAGKMDKAKAGLMSSFYSYPMGESAMEACALLKTYFNETYTYDAGKFYTNYMNHAKQLSDTKKKLNNYLMAVEVKPADPDANFEAAKLYNKLGDNGNAAYYLKKAIENGLDPAAVPSGLKSIAQ